MKVLNKEEVAFQAPEWFSKMTPKQQKNYLDEHPNSKLSKTIRKMQDKKKQEQKKPESKKPADTKKTDEKKDADIPAIKGPSANDVLKKKGSPTDFKGPKSDKDATTKNAKAERKVVSLLSRLAKLAQDAKKKGKAAPNYDLCQVSIPGSNLFCKGNKEIERKDMPQLKGSPVPGSWADKNLKKNDSGEVDGEDAFKKMLEKKGVELKKKRVDASKLRATQKELVGTKVGGMLEALKQDPNHKAITAPIFVSKDGYVLDGHHRWAAMVGLSLADGLPHPVEMDIIEVDMDIDELVKETNDFAEDIGVAQKAAQANLVVLAEFKDDCPCGGGNNRCKCPEEAGIKLAPDHPQLAKLWRPGIKELANESSYKNSEEYLYFFNAVNKIRTGFLDKLQNFDHIHSYDYKIFEDVSDRGPLNLAAARFTAEVSGTDNEVTPEDLVKVSYERDLRLMIQELGYTPLKFDKPAEFQDYDNFGETKCIETGYYVSDEEDYACVAVVARNHENVCMNFYFSVAESAQVLGGYSFKMFFSYDYSEQVV